MSRRARPVLHERPPLDVGVTTPGGAWAVAQFLGAGERFLRYKALGKGLRPAVLKEYFPARWRRVDGTPTPDRDEAFELGLAKHFREALESARVLTMHPGLIMTFDILDFGASFFAAYEWVDGEDLGARVRTRGPLLQSELAEVLRQAGDALEHLHGLGYLHGDVSPDNLIIEESGRVRLTDYERVTPYPKVRFYQDTVTINPDFAPIEMHSKFASYGPETDVYSLAATAYFALTGQRPTPARLRIANPTVPPAFSQRPGVSEAVSDAIDHAMALRASERTPTVAQFLDELGVR